VKKVLAVPGGKNGACRCEAEDQVAGLAFKHPGTCTDRFLEERLAKTRRARHTPRRAPFVFRMQDAQCSEYLGVLKPRTSHDKWLRYTNAMQAAFPDITVDADVLYIEDGRLLTSAGSAAGIDLMLRLVRCDFGAEAANSVARRLVTPPHRTGGQAQFIERPVPAVQRHELSALLDRVRTKLSEPWPLRRLAREMAMSERTFLRRFAEATGQTPNDWIIGVRIEEARRLLERAGTSIEKVAEHCGFGSLATLRHHFVRRVGVPPRDYRERFARSA
jgi:AraC family transcriptional activator FtrA